jgi:hypothetical protein
LQAAAETFQLGRRLHGMPKQTEEQLRAERIFKNRELKKADAPQAVRDYYAKIDRALERMKQLRAARLRRDQDGF